jgi:peptide alpha-N-acetyltransferase
MKRKQRKAQKKAEVEQQKHKAEMEKREQSKNKAQDGEMDGPKEEELVPDKLARVRLCFQWPFSSLIYKYT